MNKEKDILDGYFKSAKQEKVDISLSDVNAIVKKSASGINGAEGSSSSSIVTKTFFKLKYLIISSASVVGLVAWLFVLTANTDSDKQEKITDDYKDLVSLDMIQESRPVVLPMLKQDYKLLCQNIVFSDQILRRKNRIIIEAQPQMLVNDEELIQENMNSIVSDNIEDKSIEEMDTKDSKTFVRVRKSYQSEPKVLNLKTVKFFKFSKSRVYLLNSENKKIYNEISPLSYNNNQWALVKKKKKSGFIDVNGAEVVGLKYDRIYRFKEFNKSWARVERDGDVGYIDTLGNEIVQVKYTRISNFNEYRNNWALVFQAQNGYGFIDNYGFEIVKPKYHRIHFFSEYQKDWALVSRDKKYGFIDKSGKEIVPLVYDRIFHFNAIREGWAEVKTNNLFGFINKQGEELLAPTYSKIFNYGEYKKDWAMVLKNHKYGFIDINAKEVVAPEYDKIYHFGVYKPNWAMVKKEGKLGFINNEGQEIVPAKYDKIDFFGEAKNKWMRVKIGKRESFINDEGQVVLKFTENFYKLNMSYEFVNGKLLIKNKDGKLMNGDGESLDLIEKKALKK